jgi:predicted alpha/beta hydrolase family esterase
MLLNQVNSCMGNKKQIIFIRGGETFDNDEDFYEYLRTVKCNPYHTIKEWRDWIIWALEETYDLICPLMPNKQSADYNAWKIWFERHFEFITDDKPVLIGHSLGGGFLLKYLSENDFPKKVSQLHLVAPYLENEGLYLERLNTFLFDLKKINKISDMCDEIHLWHSKDDNVVPFHNGELVKENIPSVEFHIFEDRGHFRQPAFPELLEVISKINI